MATTQVAVHASRAARIRSVPPRPRLQSAAAHPPPLPSGRPCPGLHGSRAVNTQNVVRTSWGHPQQGGTVAGARHTRTDSTLRTQPAGEEHAARTHAPATHAPVELRGQRAGRHLAETSPPHRQRPRAPTGTPERMACSQPTNTCGHGCLSVRLTGSVHREEASRVLRCKRHIRANQCSINQSSAGTC